MLAAVSMIAFALLDFKTTPRRPALPSVIPPCFNLWIDYNRPDHQRLEFRVIFPVQRVALHNEFPVI
jgi:hypothetical protein